MSKIRAAITAVEGYVPDYILTNDELSKMVDTSDEWIMTRIGIKERRMLKEEGKATSDMAAIAVQNLLKNNNTHQCSCNKPDEPVFCVKGYRL